MSNGLEASTEMELAQNFFSLRFSASESKS